jgi:hypothetical protein
MPTWQRQGAIARIIMPRLRYRMTVLDPAAAIRFAEPIAGNLKVETCDRVILGRVIRIGREA